MVNLNVIKIRALIIIMLNIINDSRKGKWN